MKVMDFIYLILDGVLCLTCVRGAYIKQDKTSYIILAIIWAIIGAMDFIRIL